MLHFLHYGDVDPASYSETEPRKFGDEDLIELQRCLADSPTTDAYARSAIYYALTGRESVWVIKPGGGSIIVCAPHPNSAGDLLVFFPYARKVDELKRQIEVLREYPKLLRRFSRVLLVRIDERMRDELFRGAVGPRSEMHLFGLKLRRVEEDSLDWIYPSYDIDVHGLVEGTGQPLECFRNKIRKFDMDGVNVVSLKAMPRFDLIKVIPSIAETWATAKLMRAGNPSPDRSQLHDLVSPYRRLAELAWKRCSILDGLFLKRGDDYIGFALWELPWGGWETIPAIAALHKSYEKGLAEYLHRQVAMRLAWAGYKHMCIGGSETLGLDHFKRKLAPAATHRLCTVQLFLQ